MVANVLFKSTLPPALMTIPRDGPPLCALHLTHAALFVVPQMIPKASNAALQCLLSLNLVDTAELFARCIPYHDSTVIATIFMHAMQTENETHEQ